MNDLLEQFAAFRQETSERLDELRRELTDVKALLAAREQWFAGWKEIAAYVGISADHAQELGRSYHADPLPHYHRGAGCMVEARKTELDAWLHRRRQPAQRDLRRAQAPRPSFEDLPLFQRPRRGRAEDGSAS